MPTVKTYVAGLAKSGKTETIKCISDIPLVSVEKRLSGTDREMRLDYGRVHVQNCMLYLYGARSSQEMEWGWLKLRGEMDALIFLLSGTRAEAIEEYLATLRSFAGDWSKPFVVGINGIDDGAFRGDLVGQVSATVGSRVPVIPYNSLDRGSARALVTALVAAVPGN